MADESPKIIIDEDWKSQVQREKEEAKQREEEGGAASGAEASAPENPFLSLVAFMAMQAMHALGLLTPKDQTEIYVDLEQARFLIDGLASLREKTKGNLTPEEQGSLTETLAEAQRVYVSVAQQVQEAQLRSGNVDLKNPRSQ